MPTDHAPTSAPARRWWQPTLVFLVLLLALVPSTASAAPAKLRFQEFLVACECGGSGYLWGWSFLFVRIDGVRAGHTYYVRLDDGVVAKVDEDAVGGGLAAFRRAELVVGRTYRARIYELRNRKIVRVSRPRDYTVPRPVAGPGRARIEAGDPAGEAGEGQMVAGQTYRIEFGREWPSGIRFASGVDYFVRNGDEYTNYDAARYPLPFEIGTNRPIVEFTPTASMVGTRWHLVVVGYRAAKRTSSDGRIRKGEPIPGSEWGFDFERTVVAASG